MTDSEISRIDDKIDEDEEVDKSHLIVKRGRRESAKIDFDREAISDQNIEFFDVVDIVACEIIDEVDEEINEAMNENIATDVDVASDNADEIDEVDNAIDVNAAEDAYSLLKISFDFFACFSRT